MASFWGSRGSEELQEDGLHSSTREQHQADERTRLLPPSDREGFLNPDDPAVSPYNLWSIRALRFLTLVFLAISSIWWVLLLVSMFITPPFMYTRGSGFTGFSFTTFTLGNLIISLLFFSIPSKPMTIWNGVLAILLIADMLIITCVPQIRVEEGWVGIVSVVWAVLMSTYALGQTQAVERGKREEEERLTGRVETRRTLAQWLAVLAETVILSIMFIISILLTINLVLRASDASLPAPGKRYLVDKEKYAVHLACVGNISNLHSGDVSTILVEGGEDTVEHTLLPFIHTVYENGTIDRYCYWDRPGLSWSNNAASPHSAGMSADALFEALTIAGEEGPWILVSAGIGSIYSRIFASRHVRDVKGFFLIDPLHEDYLPEVGDPGRGFVFWGRGIISPLGMDHLTSCLFKGCTREDRIYGKRAYQGDRFLKAKLQENLVAGSMTASELASAQHRQSLDTPLVVISSGVEVRKSERWAKKQEEQTNITDNLVAWDIVEDSPHEVWRTGRGQHVLEKKLGLLTKHARVF